MSLNNLLIIHIRVIDNETSVIFSNFAGDTLFEGSTGFIGLKGKKRSTPLRADLLIKALAKKARKRGFSEAVLSIDRTGKISNNYVKWITSENIEVLKIKSITLVSNTNSF